MQMFPIDAGLSPDAGPVDLLRFDWREQTADFALPGEDGSILRVAFRGHIVVRMLDEMPLSIETDSATWHGHVPGHFAYRVEGAPFGDSQPPVWRDILGPLEHYKFVTGWGCLEVLAFAPPTFEIVPGLTCQGGGDGRG